jgi:cytochrome c biogenesis protein CcdA/thiol-disulfide isomerase/thioredoxin
MIVLLVAVLSGALSVLTPCVLPLLPAILATSTGTGRRRPFGIVIGLVGSFTIALLVFAYLVRALDIPTDTLRWISAIILVAFGAVLLVPRLEQLFERGAGVLSRFAPTGGRSSGDGFGSGLLAGAGLGLVWAPCVGPILGGVAVASSTSTTNGEQVARALAFALGMSIPLLAIVFGGQRAGNALRSRINPKVVQRVAGVVMVLTGVFVVSGLDTKTNNFLADKTGINSTLVAGLEKDVLDDSRGGSSKFTGKNVADMTEPAKKSPTDSDLPILGKAPDFTDITQWINTDDEQPLTLTGLRGKVVLIDVWTYSCINCIRTLPHVRGWYDKYEKDGLVIVGLHAPEFEFEKDEGNVRKAIKEYDITYPVAMDNDFGTWNAYQNQYWPAEYLIDAKGYVRHTHFGEGNYEDTEQAIKSLLREANPRDAKALAGTTRVADAAIQANTPETYVGYARAERFAGMPVGGALGEQKRDVFATYDPAARLQTTQWDFDGEWNVKDERAIAGDKAAIDFHYDAANVYLVLGDDGHPGTVIVHDGAETRKVPVDGHDLYTLRSSTKAVDQTMRIEIPKGISAYAFTFG